MLQIKEFIKSKLAHTFIYVAENKRYNFIVIRKAEIYAKTPDSAMHYITTMVGTQKDFKALEQSIKLTDTKTSYEFTYKYIPIAIDEGNNYIKLHSIQILKNLNPNV